MSRPSSARGNYSTSSPAHERRFISSFLSEDRNNEHNHKDALQAAQAEHDRVREAAIRVFEMHEMREEHKRIIEAEKKEQERLKAEAAIAEETRRLQELKAKSIPKPAPLPDPPKAIKETQQTEEIKPKGSSQPQESPREKKTSPFIPAPAAATEAKAPAPNPFANPAQRSPFAAVPSASQQQNGLQAPQNFAQKSPFTQQVPQTMQTPQSTAPPPQAQPTQDPKPPTQRAAPARDRYLEIHQELKKLRERMQAEAKAAGPPLKGQMGDFRRVIRVSVGQLTGGKGANAQPVRNSLYR